jgi:hypothetical protein
MRGQGRTARPSSLKVPARLCTARGLATPNFSD